MEKTCIKCQTLKPIETFAAKGAANVCKKCHSLQVMACRKARLASGDAREKKRALEKGLGIQTCKECQVEKPLSEFHASKHHKRLGVLSVCKECTNIKSMKWKADNRETARALSREWHKKYPEKSRAFQKKRYESMSEEDREIARKRATDWYRNPKNKERAAQNKRDYLEKNRPEFLMRARNYRLVKHKAMPKWLTAIQRAQIEEFYEVCAAVNMQTGIKHEVDHIIPLNGETVCGLHVPWNLQILTRFENRSKSNRLLER